jgi:hypothetical protein
MGTDISIYPERLVNGHWQFIGEMIKNMYYEYDPEHEPPYIPNDLYDLRNYSLFAILADVRNNEGYECITPCRGIPEDLSPEIKSWFEYYQEDALDASWFTLEELINFDWHGKRIQRYASVDKRVAHLFHSERGFPFHEWPAGIQCSYSPCMKEDGYWNATWTATYAEAAGSDFMKLLDTFAGQYGVSKDVRFVFWFTS